MTKLGKQRSSGELSHYRCVVLSQYLVWTMSSSNLFSCLIINILKIKLTLHMNGTGNWMIAPPPPPTLFEGLDPPLN